ncbi:MAG: response regulator [Candidatus Eremiobacterota bacterium]
MYNRTIFIADDDENFLDIYTIIFTRQFDLSHGEETEEDFHLKTFSDGQYLLDAFRSEYGKGNRTPLCILDMKMPRLGGLETASAVRNIDSEVIIILVTAYSDISLATIKENLKKDIYYITKPFNKEELYCLVDSLIKGWNKNIQIKESEEKYRTIFESFVDVYYRTDMDGIIALISPSIKSYCGYEPEELTGLPIKSICPDISQYDILLRDLYNSHVVKDYEIKLKSKDEREIYFSANTHIVFSEDDVPLAIEGVLRDITERKKAEEDKKKLESQLRQKQKMEAIGTLAGGIAHDFNNILSAVIGFTYLALKEIPEGSKVYSNLEEVIQASYRATDLVKQILAFSRQSEQEKMPVQINVIVKEVLKLLRASLPATVEIRQKLGGGPYTVIADTIQIHQLLMNLCTNAFYAMREKGGIMEVSLSNFDMDINNAVLYEGLKSGPYVKLVVKDTGHGIEPDILEHIFEPYFTTKDPGEGTGLGLSVVHGIVRSHGGDIIVNSQPGKGTVFEVLLPRIDTEVPQKVSFAENLPGGTENILFVDDDRKLVYLGKKMLEDLGYTVIALSSSSDALDIFKNEPDKFDIIITDQTMPEKTGIDLVKNILSIRPDLPVILSTGYSDMITAEKAKKIGVREFTMKPFDIRVMAKLIRKVLDEK